VIQLGVIVAVCREFRPKLTSVVVGLRSRPNARRFALNVIVATVPAIVLALLFERAIKPVPFAPVPIVFAPVADRFCSPISFSSAPTRRCFASGGQPLVRMDEHRFAGGVISAMARGWGTKKLSIYDYEAMLLTGGCACATSN